MPLPGKGKTAPAAPEIPVVAEAAAEEEPRLAPPPPLEGEAKQEISPLEKAKQAAAALIAEAEAEAKAKEMEKAQPEPEPESAMPFDADESYVEEARTQAVVPKPATPPAQASTSGSGAVIQELSQQGFEGVDVSYGTFPQVSLKNSGKFESSEGWEMGDSFNALLMGSKVKWICKNTKCEKADEDLVFTYDKVNDVNGKPIQSTIDHWEAQGWGYEMKEYREVPAELAGGDWDGELIILSIPFTSIRRFNRHLIKTQRAGVDLAEVPTRICVGAQITSVDFPFFPWDFKLA